MNNPRFKIYDKIKKRWIYPGVITLNYWKDRITIKERPNSKEITYRGEVPDYELKMLKTKWK